MGSDYNQGVGFPDEKVFALVAAAKAKNLRKVCVGILLAPQILTCKLIYGC